MYNSSSELIKNELSNDLLQPIYNIFEDATIVFTELIEKEQDIFRGSYFGEFKGRLINYVIKRFFDIDRIPKSFPFEVNAIGMAFGQKRTELKRGNILLTLSRAQNPNMLPGYSQYKKEYSLGNSTIGKQLKIYEDKKEIKVSEIPYYGIITYNLRNNVLDFLNIVIPDSEFKNVIDCIPINQKLRLVRKEFLYNNEDTYERVLGRENIKKDIIDSIKKFEQEMR